MAVRPSQMRHVLTDSDREYLESLGGVAAPGTVSNPSQPGGSGRSNPGSRSNPSFGANTSGPASGSKVGSRTRPPTAAPGYSPDEFDRSAAPTADLPVTMAPTTPAGNRMLGIVVGVIATAAIGGGAIYLAGGRGGNNAPPPSTTAPAPQTATQPATQQPATQPPTSAPAVAAAVVVAPPPVAPKLNSNASGGSADAAVAQFRTSTLAARQRAADAGATAAELAGGDAQLKVADAAAAKGQASTALSALSAAGARWADGERTARERTAARVATAKPVEQAPATPVQTAPAPVVALPAPAPVVAQPVVEDPRVGIDRAIAAYARAIETEDVSEIRRAYPGLTNQQAQGWDAFFKSVKNLKAHITVDAANVSGGTAEAQVAGTYEYDARSNGNHDKTPVKFNASLVKESVGWRLNLVH